MRQIKETIQKLLDTDLKKVAIEELDFSKKYDLLKEIVRGQGELVNEISKFIREGENPSDWLTHYVSYIDQLKYSAISKEKPNGEFELNWPGIYDIERKVNWWFICSITKESNKALKIIEFADGLKRVFEDYDYPANYLSRIITIFCEDWDGIVKKWELTSEEEIKSAQYFLSTLLDISFKYTVHPVDQSGVSQVFSTFFYLKQNFDKLPEELVVPLKTKFLALNLFGFKPNCFGDVRELVEELYNENREEIYEIGQPEKIRESEKLDSSASVLTLLLDNAIQALKSINIHDLIEYQKAGANLSNVRGVPSFMKCLGCITIFEKENELIASYFEDHINEDDELYILAMSVNDIAGALGVKSKGSDKGKVIKTVYQQLGNKAISGKGKIEIDRFLKFHGLANNLQAENTIVTPKKLAQNTVELEDQYAQLQLKNYINLNAGTSELDLTWPKELLQVYTWKNGSDQRQFQAVEYHEQLKSDILQKLGDDNDLIDEIEDSDFVYPTVNISTITEADIFPIGTDHSGDMYFLNSRNHQIIKYHHDEIFTGTVVAQNVYEFISKLFIEKCIEVYGPNEALKSLIQEK